MSPLVCVNATNNCGATPHHYQILTKLTHRSRYRPVLFNATTTFPFRESSE